VSLLNDGLAALGPWITAYGALAVFIIIYLESFGMPLPGESCVVAASLLAAHNQLSIVLVILAVLSGAMLGDSTGYLIGKFGGQRVLQRIGPWVKLTPERLASFEERFQRQGFWMVAFARFVIVLRQINGIMAGSLAMPWHVFVSANVIGAVLWTAVYTLGPYWFTELFHKLL